MNNWMVTNQLRFVERKFKWISTEGDYEERTHQVIQQKWRKPSDYSDFDVVVDDEYFKEEWRDVPVVEEE